MSGKLPWADHPQVIFFTTLYRASPPLTALWWGLLLLGGVLPAMFTLASDSPTASTHSSVRRGTKASRSHMASGRSWRWLAASCVTGLCSHDELMEADGTYAELFRLQANSYR